MIRKGLYSIFPAAGKGLATLALLLSAGTAAAAQPTIDIGMSAAFTGPAKSLGLAMRQGIEAHFAEINRAGGLHGRELRLIALDDGYHPAAAERQMTHLIDDRGVLAVIGNVGTPTAKVTVPIAQGRKTLLFGAFTGAGLLRPDPPHRYVMNLRASYDEEMETVVDAILKLGIHPDEIAFFTQNDSYGEAGYQGAQRALRKRGYDGGEALPRGGYSRNTMDVEEALVSLIDAPTDPRAIIIVGAYMPSAKFIRLARDLFPGVRFFNISFIGALPLARALPGDTGEVYVSQVVPPLGADLPLLAAYRKALAAHAPDAEPDYVSLEGYVAARVLAEGIKKAGPKADREKLVEAMEGLTDLEIGLGFPLRLSARDHQASHRVWMTVIENGKVLPAAGEK